MGFSPAGQKGQPSFEVLKREAGVLTAPRNSSTSKPPKKCGLRGMLSHTQSQSHTVTQLSPRGTHSDTQLKACNPPGIDVHHHRARLEGTLETTSQSPKSSHTPTTAVSSQRRTHPTPRALELASERHAPHSAGNVHFYTESHTNTQPHYGHLQRTATQPPRKAQSHTQATKSHTCSLSYMLVTCSHPHIASSVTETHCVHGPSAAETWWELAPVVGMGVSDSQLPA